MGVAFISLHDRYESAGRKVWGERRDLPTD